MTTIKSTYNTLVLGMFFSLAIFAGCKKEKADQIPVVSIISPTANQQFNSPDSIFVNATITDDKLINAVKITVTDQNFTSIQTPVFLYPNTKSYDLNLIFYIDDNIKESGNYYLLVKAEDGTNYKNSYQPIQINAIPQQLERALVITEASSNQLQIFKFTLNSDPALLSTITSDFTASAINSPGKQLYIAGSTLTNVIAFNLIDNLIDWQLDPVPLQPMHNNNCLFFDEQLFVTYYTDYIYGYSSSASIVFNSSVEETESPTVIWKKGNYVLADFQRTNNGQTFIKTMFVTTGLEKQRILTNYQVVGFHSQAGDKVLITANSGLQGLVLLYNVEQNVISTIDENGGLIRCSITLDNEKVMIGTEQGLYLYDPGQLFLVNISDELIPDRMTFDKVSSQLFLVIDNEVQIKSWPQMVNQKTIMFSDTILDLHLQYTK